MVETLTNLQHVYAKWEKNNPYKSDSLSHYDNHLPNQSLPGRMSQNQSLPGRMSQNQYDTMITSGRTAWKTRYKATNQQLPVRRQKGPRSRGPEGIPALSMVSFIHWRNQNSCEIYCFFKNVCTILMVKIRN